MTIEGDLTIVGGTKSAAVPHTVGSYGQMYCMESPESWFEDFAPAPTCRQKVARLRRVGLLCEFRFARANQTRLFFFTGGLANPLTLSRL